ncbi:MAG: superinfection immunity protein [Gammaproteobacteria bacterium]
MAGSIALLLLFIIIYFLPSFIARDRNHPSRNSILVINIFLGWTLLGWVIALAWSVSHTSADNKSPV